MKEVPSNIPPDAREAIVISASRRHVILSPDGVELLKGTTSSKALDVTVGDKVLYAADGRGVVFIHALQPRKNCVSRSFHGTTRLIAANLDHLFIVAAVLPLFNTIFIDRIAAVAHAEGIPVSILVNKVDLGMESTSRLVEVYDRLGFNVLLTSARLGSGIEGIREILARPDFSVVALAGISGVGKSTFVNQLIPGAARPVGEIREGKGAGRQTTSQSFGFLYERPENSGVLIIDLPGIQNFGVSHLSREQIAESFCEIIKYRNGCEFSNCSHILEDKCAVKEAVESGEIADCRYQSYLHMLDELDMVRKY